MSNKTVTRSLILLALSILSALLAAKTGHGFWNGSHG
jgi:hypothetical protein